MGDAMKTIFYEQEKTSLLHGAGGRLELRTRGVYDAQYGVLCVDTTVTHLGCRVEEGVCQICVDAEGLSKRELFDTSEESEAIAIRRSVYLADKLQRAVANRFAVELGVGTAGATDA